MINPIEIIEDPDFDVIETSDYELEIGALV